MQLRGLPDYKHQNVLLLLDYWLCECTHLFQHRLPYTFTIQRALGNHWTYADCIHRTQTSGAGAAAERMTLDQAHRIDDPVSRHHPLSTARQTPVSEDLILVGVKPRKNPIPEKEPAIQILGERNVSALRGDLPLPEGDLGTYGVKEDWERAHV